MSVARSTLFNLAGHVAPLVAAFVAMPMLVAKLAPERFGFLSLAWVLVGYFTLFDLGFGRALARLGAQRAAGGRAHDVASLARTALFVSVALGAIGALVLFATAAPICARLLGATPLRGECTQALQVLALALPFLTTTSVLRGLLEGASRFGWINAIRVPIGILNFVGPMAMVALTTSLPALAALLVVTRIVDTAAHWVACRIACRDWLVGDAPRYAHPAEMFRFGAWVTVSNVVGPLMVYLDRFVIAGLISLSAVAYYTAPYEVLTRLWIIPAALTAALFPMLTSTYVAQPDRAIKLYGRGIKAVLAAVLPLALAATVFADDLLSLWLGSEYARNGARVAQILALGVLINCLAYVPLTLLQAIGRADLAAKLHLIEAPFYGVMLWLLATSAGIEGVALAWALRCAGDAAALFVLAQISLPASRRQLGRAKLLALGAALTTLPVALTLPQAMSAKVSYFVIAVGLALCGMWSILLDAEERLALRRSVAWLGIGERAR